jgi:hypothetical protein
MKRWFFNVLIAIDQLINTLVGGEPDETLSSAAFRMHEQGKFWGWTMHLINGLFFDSAHCANAYLSERNRKHLAKDFQ